MRVNRATGCRKKEESHITLSLTHSLRSCVSERGRRVRECTPTEVQSSLWVLVPSNSYE